MLSEPVAMAFEDDQSMSDPTLSPDNLTLYFYRQEGALPARVYRAVRPSRDAEFAAPQMIGELASDDVSRTGFFELPDRLTAYYAQRVGDHSDLFAVTRSAIDQPFGNPQPISELNTPGHEFNPRVAPDGRTIIYVHWNDPTDITTADILIAHRDSSDEPWRDVERASLSTLRTDAAAGFVGNSNTVIYEADGEIRVARRSGPDAAYASEPIEQLNTAAYDGLPFPSADGCELWFLSDRPGRSGRYDIMYARVVGP